MKQLLGIDSFTEFGNNVLNGIADFSNTNLIEIQQRLFNTLKRPPSQLSNVIPDFMSIEQMLDGSGSGKNKSTRHHPTDTSVITNVS